MSIGQGLSALKSVKEIGFVEFTTDLVRNVYDIIVDSAMDQMKAYVELVEEVSKPLSEYQNDVTGIDLDGIDWSNLSNNDQNTLDSYISNVLNLSLSGGNVSLPIKKNGIITHFQGLQIDDSGNKKTIEELITGQQSIDANSLRKFVVEKLKETTSDSYNMLVTILKLGLNKVVVTDGSIHSKLLFDVKALESKSTSSTAIDSSQKNWGVQGRASARWGWGRASVSGGYNSRKIAVKVVNENSSSFVKMNGNILGSVTINFETETFDSLDQSQLN